MPEDWQNRFWKKVEIRDENSCWNWMGAISSNGYGSFYLNGKIVTPHRTAYKLHYGIIDERFVCHSCDNRKCCNPSHLFLGTHTDNMRDMTAKGRGVVQDWQKGYAAAKATGRFVNTAETSVKGTKNGQAKLNEESVLEIRKMLESGHSHRKIARQFGVSKSLVAQISQKEIWKHV